MAKKISKERACFADLRTPKRADSESAAGISAVPDTLMLVEFMQRRNLSVAVQRPIIVADQMLTCGIQTYR